MCSKLKVGALSLPQENFNKIQNTNTNPCQYPQLNHLVMELLSWTIGYVCSAISTNIPHWMSQWQFPDMTRLGLISSVGYLHDLLLNPWDKFPDEALQLQQRCAHHFLQLNTSKQNKNFDTLSSTCTTILLYCQLTFLTTAPPSWIVKHVIVKPGKNQIKTLLASCKYNKW